MLLGTSCADPATGRSDGALVVAVETQAAWVRCFNPLLPDGTCRWPARGGIYEPLAVRDRTNGRWVPWLAESWAWEDGALRFTVRDARWSDGEPFSANDVAFTFALLREHPALDALGVWDWLASVEAVGDTVTFRFTRPYSPGFEDLAEQPIVARHTWAGVADPVAWDDPEPVGTGPFTEVLRFGSAEWVLGRNPWYWQAGRPAVPALRFPAFAGNDAANLALVTGEVDWAGSFVPAVERTFVGRDPEGRVAWSPPVDGTVYLYANTAVAPFGDRRVREALSRAVDRDRLVAIAMEGTTRPADASGLSDALATYRDPALRADWMTHDPDEAARMLAASGVAGFEVEILVVSGWSDWTRAAQLIARDLEAVGMRARVRPVDFAGWLDRVRRGDYALTIGWSTQGSTPYAGYRDLMGGGSVRPLGEPAGNWARYASPRADSLLAEVEATTDPGEQAALFGELQAVFAEELPAIPLFSAPAWGEANTRWFDGFPSEADPWATLSPNRQPESLLVLTALEPR